MRARIRICSCLEEVGQATGRRNRGLGVCNLSKMKKQNVELHHLGQFPGVTNSAVQGPKDGMPKRFGNTGSYVDPF